MRLRYSRRLGFGDGSGILFNMKVACAVSASSVLLALPASGQSVCHTELLSNPQRQAVVCGGGFRMEIEAGASATIFARRGNAPPRLVEVEGGGVLIESKAGGGNSQIRTPHAIAAVRGTEYIVDVSDTRTSVFVLEGAVEVRGNGVLIGRVRLDPGQGVDVTGMEPLNVRIWPAARVEETLSRFGR